MGTAISIHHGPYGPQIPPLIDASLDSIFSDKNRINPYFTPNATIFIGSSPPTEASQAVPLLEVRSRHLSKFRH
ncbi:uncharacterized protein N7529_012082 [Penicillium soppii]|uniref:uncharacterized protein n=1 Tax=Penicillium soppii TaxID=69789 RepID=UPI00254792DE|nr:uncharacterized protein N7529_012082 [Penicillium soppii]KAJ5852697.1 hypothetical protein N7529_012082 [Penicillium soppii]